MSSPMVVAMEDKVVHWFFNNKDNFNMVLEVDYMLARKATTPWKSCMRTTSLTLRESPQQLTEGWLNTFMQ